MAKDKEDKKEGGDKAELPADEAAAKAKKKKLLIMIIGGVVATAGIGGGLAFFLAGGSKEGGGEHSEPAPAEEHGEKKAEEHGEKKAEEHGEKKAEEHGEKKAEEHGEKKAEEHGEKKAEEKGDKKGGEAAELEGVDFGCTHPLPAFHLNLGNPLENRYIRLEVAIEYPCKDETIKAELEKRQPQLRDAIIAVTSRKTREFLLGPDGKEQLRKEIQTRVNHYMSRKIDDVFITDILIE